MAIVSFEVFSQASLFFVEACSVYWLEKLNVDHKGYPFWQVQSMVPAEVVRSFTKTCEREDCTVSFRISETTCMTTANWYDKNGLLHIEDHNSFTGKICCRKCWRSGIIDNNGQLLEEHRIYSNHNKK